MIHGFGPLHRAKFHVARGIFGDFRPKKPRKFAKKSKVANFFTTQGRIPRPLLVKFMCYMRLICLCNVLNLVQFGS